MTEYEALQIVLSLAIDNALEEDDAIEDPILEIEWMKQQHALDVVEKLAQNLKKALQAEYNIYFNGIGKVNENK